MAKKQVINNIGANFHLADFAENTMADMNGHTTEEKKKTEKNVSLQVKESLRNRLRLMSAKENVKIQSYVEYILSAALTEKGY